MRRYALSFFLATLLAVAQTPTPAASADAVSVLAFNYHDPLPFMVNMGLFNPNVFFIIITTDKAIEAYRVSIFYDDDEGKPNARTATVDRNRAPTANTPDPATCASFSVSARNLRYTVTPLVAHGAVVQSPN